MSRTMGARLEERPPFMDTTVAIDYEVIAYRAETSLFMPSSDVLDGEVLAVGRGGAMDDDFSNGTHEEWE